MKQNIETLNKELSKLKAKRAEFERKQKIEDEIKAEKEKIRELNPSLIDKLFRR